MSKQTASRRFRLAGACLGALLLSACASVDGPSPVLIPNKALELSRSVTIPADTIALAAVAYVIIDPLAPTWRVEQYDLGGGRYRIALRKKRFSSGGDGESQQIFRRRIDQITREQGFASFAVLEFSEGIESHMPIAQRVSHGVVQFAR